MAIADIDDPEQLHYIRLQCLSDTGYLARTLLGYNYDRDGDEHVNVGTGGIRSTGPHAEMCRFVDSEDDQFQLLMAPRKSLKTSIVLAYCVRRILLNPNIRILYGTYSDDKCGEFTLALRNALESAEVTALFGDQRGDPVQDGRPWETDRFTVAGRTNFGLTSPTVRTFSLKTRPTGGRGDLIIADDLIMEEHVKTPEAIENAKVVFRMLFPLRETGAKTLAVGTKYADMDLYYEIENNPLYKKLIYGAGVKVVRKPGGALDLELEPGLKEPLFPNLTMKYLKQALASMSAKGDYRLFSCQYLNIVPAGVGQTFQRIDFKPKKWRHEHLAWSGYLLTDTATSQRDEGCYSVIAYILLSQNNRYALADLRVGHMRPAEFVDQFFDVLGYWSNKAYHCGEVWERISLVSWAQAMLALDPRSKKVRLQPIEIGRASSDNKFVRIDRVEPILREGRFQVLDCVPRKFIDLDGEKVLYDPEGYIDSKTGMRLPAGELVDEFIRLRSPGTKTDIADAIAMVAEVNPSTGRPLCVYRQPSQRHMQLAGLTSSVPSGQTVALPDVSGSADWWDRTTEQFFKR